MLKSSWSSLESVFLIRKAVRRAVGFWYQHSFMTFTMADNILKRQKKYKTPHFQNVIVLLRIFMSTCVCLFMPNSLLGENGVCCADWASAGPHTPPFSSPQSWDPRAPGQRRVDGNLPQCLKKPPKLNSGSLVPLLSFSGAIEQNKMSEWSN